MNEQLNRVVKINGGDYKITSVSLINPKLENTIRTCERTGKYPAYFGARKILKNGSLSEKQTKCLLIFKESGNFITL